MNTREFEIQKLKAAIKKTEAAQVRADATQDALYRKLERQKGELVYQKIMLWAETIDAKGKP